MPEADEAERAEREAELPMWLELNESLREAGLLVATGRLHHPGSATTVRMRGGETELTDGPFATTKEFLAGYYLLECDDLDQALRQAERVPLTRYGSVEVRPVMAAAEVARAFRDERAAVLATLIRHVGDFQLAEDAVQDAFTDAVAAWRRDGVPARPGAWLTIAARRRAIDRLRRDRSLADRADRLAELARLDSQEHPSMNDESAIVDDRLRLIF